MDNSSLVHSNQVNRLMFRRFRHRVNNTDKCRIGHRMHRAHHSRRHQIRRTSKRCSTKTAASSKPFKSFKPAAKTTNACNIIRRCTGISCIWLNLPVSGIFSSFDVTKYFSGVLWLNFMVVYQFFTIFFGRSQIQHRIFRRFCLRRMCFSRQ